LTTPKRILVTDDEPFLLSLLEDFCEDIDVVAILAKDGAECLEKAKTEKPDAITVDNRMPDQLGLDVITQLKADPTTQQIPVVLLSGDNESVEAEAKKRGAFGVLRKPITREAFRQMLESCLGTW
jgi:CheY-like chemotaxis protein